MVSPRDLKQIARRCVLFGSAAILLFLGIRAVLIAHQGIETDAVVTWWDRCRTDGVCLRYRFEHEGVEYRGRGSVSLETWSKVGSQLKVRFVPSFPSLNEPSAERSPSTLLVLVSMYGIVVFAVIAWRWRNRRV